MLANLQTISIVLHQMCVLKQTLLILFLFTGLGACLGQVDTAQAEITQTDTIRPALPKPAITRRAVVPDSLRHLIKRDSVAPVFIKDSLAVTDSIRKAIQSKFPLVHADTTSYRKYEPR